MRYFSSTCDCAKVQLFLLSLAIVEMAMCIARLDSHPTDIIGVFRFLFILGALEAQLNACMVERVRRDYPPGLADGDNTSCTF